MDKCVDIVVKGRVQGVGFRWYVQQKAVALNLTGFVRNLPNQDVELEVEGDEEKLKQLIVQVRKGPTFSKVIDLVLEWREAKGLYDSFDITY